MGNRQLGKLPLAGGYYDYANDGLRWGTDDDEFNFGIRAMQQLDARIYANPNQEYASSGIFNPRTRIYFYGHLTRPFSYEFSFQESYGTLNLLDSYVNYRLSATDSSSSSAATRPRSPMSGTASTSGTCSPRSGRFLPRTSKAIAASVSWAGEARSTTGWNMRSAPSTVNVTGTCEFNSSQDIMAFLNFKPFYNREDSLLRDLHFGGSVDAGIENNPLSPAVLTTSAPPSPSGLSPGSPAVPFLAFNNGVMERGYRALWELHLGLLLRGPLPARCLG